METWQNPETLALWFGIVILFVLSLVVSIIVLVRMNYRKILKRNRDEAASKIQHQRELLENSINIQEKERDRIASDLHDSLIGKLTVIRLKNQIDNTDQTEIDQLMNESIVAARRISHDLSPPLIEYTPLNELIKGIAEPWSAKFGVLFKMDLRNVFEISASVKIQITRILQELLTNIGKHAEATTVNVHLRQTEQCISLIITDDGKGMDPEKIKRGLGLKSLESRVQFVNGIYKVKSKLTKGTRFIFLLQDKS